MWRDVSEIIGWSLFSLHIMRFCFFFKQKTAYEMRISDWSSDVCSSDLPLGTAAVPGDPGRTAGVSGKPAIGVDLLLTDAEGRALAEQRGKEGQDRKSVV